MSELPTIYLLAPTRVSGLTNITALAAGSARSLALRGDRTISAWGANGYGQLGDGTAGFSPEPLQVLVMTGTLDCPARCLNGLPARLRVERA